MNIALYQGRFPVGKIEDNLAGILNAACDAKARKVEVLFFPELCLSGYFPEDLLFHPEFKMRIEQAFEALIREIPQGIVIGVGLPLFKDDRIYNGLVMLEQGKVLYEYHKQMLPNFGVFDEKRYFTAGEKPGVFVYKGQKIGLLICEDLWHSAPLQKLKNEVLDLIVSVNASPFEIGKVEARNTVAKNAVALLHAPLLYVHQIGLQDECIYDGASFYMNTRGESWYMPQFETRLAIMPEDGAKKSLPQDSIAQMYQALCFALKSYVEFWGFKGILIGLSGGIDSALTLAIAVDALGANRVQVVMMPSRYSASMSLDDAKAQAELSNVDYKIIPIEPLFAGFLKEVAPSFDRQEPDVTEENIQSRLRGMILMALSNKSGKVVISTTNKSEASVGYGTLYGDLIGGFMLLKDVYKTDVYKLARYRNSLGLVIPERVISRAPSAELRENQTDQDSLPDYDMLDRILKAYIEENYSPRTIEKLLNIDRKMIDHVINLIRKSEFKRRQTPFGPKISARSLGKEWRMPVMA